MHANKVNCNKYHRIKRLEAIHSFDIFSVVKTVSLHDVRVTDPVY